MTILMLMTMMIMLMMMLMMVMMTGDDEDDDSEDDDDDDNNDDNDDDDNDDEDDDLDDDDDDVDYNVVWCIFPRCGSDPGCKARRRQVAKSCHRADFRFSSLISGGSSSCRSRFVRSLAR